MPSAGRFSHMDRRYEITGTVVCLGPSPADVERHAARLRDCLLEEDTRGVKLVEPQTKDGSLQAVVFGFVATEEEAMRIVNHLKTCVEDSIALVLEIRGPGLKLLYHETVLPPMI